MEPASTPTTEYDGAGICQESLAPFAPLFHSFAITRGPPFFGLAVPGGSPVGSEPVWVRRGRTRMPSEMENTIRGLY